MHTIISSASLIFILLITDIPCACCLEFAGRPHSSNVSNVKPECAAFHSQHKAAGSTIVHTFRAEPLSGYEEGSHIFKCDQRQHNVLIASCYPPTTMKVPYFLYGGLALTMSNHDLFNHHRCIWLTMFREPVSRLVSSYLYCKHSAKDAVCGSNRLQAAKATIEEWAEHWGNFLFRELLLYPPMLEKAMPRTGHVYCNALCEAHQQHPHDKFWYKWKVALGEGQNLESKAGQQNMQLVEQHLRGDGVHRMYDTFGITTQFNKSMWFFDRTVPLHTTWAELALKHHQGHGKTDREEKYQDDMLEAAKKNKRVLEALKADLKIYNEIVVPLFDSLALSFGAPSYFKANREPDLD